MTAFRHTLRSIIDDIVTRKDNETLSRLYNGICVAEKNHPRIFRMYPSHLRKHAACHTGVDALIEEWTQYVKVCTFETNSIPMMWYLWTDALDDTATSCMSTTTVTDSVQSPDKMTDAANGDIEELHSSNHRMYMIARKYKRNIKTLKSKYADRKKQVREFTEWYSKFERKTKTLHSSLSSILRYVHTTVDVASTTCDCPTDEEMQNMSFENLVRAITDLINDRNVAYHIDAENIQSYQLRADDPFLPAPTIPRPCGEYDDDECDSVISSITDILDPVTHQDQSENVTASVGTDVDPTVYDSIQHIDKLLREACV